MEIKQKLLLAVITVIVAITPFMVSASASTDTPSIRPLVTGLTDGSGSTIGPDGSLYVTEGATGTILRVNPETGDFTQYATGLPKAIDVIGGAVDIAFLDGIAYVLVTLVGSDIGGSDIVGIYRIDSPNSFTVIADIGAFSIANPPSTAFFIPTGVQYALATYRGSLLVTDGHHNRVLRVGLDGQITEVIVFENVVPTGMAIKGSRVYMSEAGPVPHLPADGKIVSFRVKWATAEPVASGAPLLVDVEFGRGHSLYGLSQGYFAPGYEEGSPAEPDTGSLFKVNRDGTISVVAEGLNQPTSLEIIGETAYVVNLGGEIWKIAHIGGPRHGHWH